MTRERRPSDHDRRAEHGQVLLIVAIGLVVVLVFVALAVDVGHWYGQRRHMQNAADAGALAGAYQYCYEAAKSEADVIDAALDYAEMNGATRALSQARFIQADGMVVVTATAPAEFFFARIIPGMADFPISAVAAGQCGEADMGCGMWPVALDQISYETIDLTGHCNGPTEWDNGAYINTLVDNSGIARAEGSQFILWAGDNTNFDPVKVERHCYFESHPEGEAHEYTLAGVIGGSPMDPGNRGWVSLKLLPGYQIPEPSPYEDCKSYNNCGASALNCWLQNGYIGQIAIGDCLATQDGNINNAITTYAKYKVGEPVSVILYDHPSYSPGTPDCDPSSNPATCNGSKAYHVSGIGCVLVEHVFDGKNCHGACSNDRKHDYLQWRKYELGGTNPGDDVYTAKSSVGGEYGFGCYKDGNTWKCADNEPLTFSCPSPGIGIVVTKLCACPPTMCVSSGGRGGNSAINAVSLVPVPTS